MTDLISDFAKTAPWAFAGAIIGALVSMLQVLLSRRVKKHNVEMESLEFEHHKLQLEQQRLYIELLNKQTELLQAELERIKIDKPEAAERLLDSIRSTVKQITEAQR